MPRGGRVPKPAPGSTLERASLMRQSPITPRRCALIRAMQMPTSACASVYSRQHDFDNAIKDYTEAIRLDPKSAAAYEGRR